MTKPRSRLKSGDVVLLVGAALHHSFITKQTLALLHRTHFSLTDNDPVLSPVDLHSDLHALIASLSFFLVSTSFSASSPIHFSLQHHLTSMR